MVIHQQQQRIKYHRPLHISETSNKALLKISEHLLVGHLNRLPQWGVHMTLNTQRQWTTAVHTWINPPSIKSTAMQVVISPRTQLQPLKMPLEVKQRKRTFHMRQLLSWADTNVWRRQRRQEQPKHSVGYLNRNTVKMLTSMTLIIITAKVTADQM